MIQEKQTPEPIRLVVPRDEAVKKIKERIEKGGKIKNLKLITLKSAKVAKGERSHWIGCNTELFSRLFENSAPIVEKYNHLDSNDTYETSYDFTNDMDYRIIQLNHLIERLELIPEPDEATAPSPTLDRMQHPGDDVFIIHCHDEAAKESVARFIEKLDLNPIILHERPNKSRTIIEKFEDYSNVGFAIVLLTPDDVGASKEEKENLKHRARQNVIFELGYFIGKLGRERVCALYKEDVEVLSDFKGVLYLPMDSAGGWRLDLAKEVKAAGINVDLNRIVERS
jgi:predicted nucleotide-binding protein